MRAWSLLRWPAWMALCRLPESLEDSRLRIFQQEGVVTNMARATQAAGVATAYRASG